MLTTHRMIPRPPRTLLAAMLCVALAATPAPARSDDAARANTIGYDIDLADLPSPRPRPDPRSAPGAAEGRPVVVRILIPWSLIEKSPGLYDWSVLDQQVRDHAAAGFQVVLDLRGGNPLHTGEGAVAPGDEAWVAFLRAVAGRYGDEADDYVIGEDQPAVDRAPARMAAFWLKTSSVALRSADPGCRIALGGVDVSRAGEADRLAALYAEDLAVYADAVTVAGAEAPGGEAGLTGIKGAMLLGDPSAELWLAGRRVPGGAASSGRLLRSFLRGLRREAALSLFRLDADPSGMPALLPALARINGLFGPSYSPLVESGRGIALVTPMGATLPAETLRLFDPEEKKVLIAFDGGEGAERGMQAVLVIDTIDLAEPVLRDVAAGEAAPAGAYQMDEEAGLTRVAVPVADYPLVLEYRRFTSPLFGEEERLQVTGKRLPSVEEILAKHQVFHAAQDALLTNLRADARVDYHFRIGTGSTVDVTVTNNFYLDPRVGPEFEQLEFFVNGVKWRSNRIPEFPLPQPEKVMAVPLDIALDKRYAYNLVGETSVDGYDCWVIDFTPVVSDRSLYRGRVWIDKKTYAKVQISSVQTGLQSPIISNDEKDSYRPLKGPDGLTYWLLARIDGQQVFSTTGRNLVIVREVTFANHVINDPGFEEAHRRAYASERQILRETSSGQRYLERTADGGRVVKDELDRDNLFLLGGAFYNRSLEFPVPLAGVNYFNRDLGGRGIQTNVLFGGVLLFATASHPDMFGTGLEGSGDLTAQAFSSTDRPVRDGREVERENVDLISQRLVLGLGLPFAEYWKVKWTGSLEFQGFARDAETRARFVVPTDTVVTTLGMEGEFNRKAWTVAASVQVGDRKDWEFWGDPLAPLSRRDFFEGSKDYIRYHGAVAKDFFLPLNQKIHASLSAFGGNDLDRFSKYRFDFFGNRLRGLSGTGFRYTQGAKAQAQYAFNLGDIIRFEATVDHARVKDGQFPDPGGDDYKSFTGFGISGQTIVGPNLIVSLDWGIAVSSDVDDFRGDQEIFITVLRLFR